MTAARREGKRVVRQRALCIEGDERQIKRLVGDRLRKPRHVRLVPGMHRGDNRGRLDLVDGAARVVDPIVRGEAGEDIYGCFLKDFEPSPW